MSGIEEFLTKEQIEVRAYNIYVERGCEDGHALQDWLIAEEELKQLQEIKPTPSKSKAVAAGQLNDTVSSEKGH